MINDEWFASLSQPLAELARRGLEYLPSVLGAVLLLVIGWLVARLLRAWTARSLARLNRLIAGKAVEQELKASGADRLASEAASLIVFWLVFLVFLAAAGEVLGLAVVTTGLSRLAQYLPNILGAVLVVLAGLVLANLARGAVGRAAVSAKLGYGAALGQSARVIILLVAGVIALDQLGVDSQLLIVSTNILIASVIGGTALAFALGSRTAVSNILALHYLTQTYEVGQRIRVGDVEGEIVEFKKTGVVLASADGLVLVPAQEFSEQRSTLLAEAQR
jgi:small-conductance mechanosensitive channel